MPVPFAGGDGTLANPYLIENEAQLRNLDGAGNLLGAYRLIADVALDGPWYSPPNLYGVFDGAGHSINGLESTPGVLNFGLFNELWGGSIVQRLKVKTSATGIVRNATTHGYAGILANNIRPDAFIQHIITSGYIYVGQGGEAKGGGIIGIYWINPVGQETSPDMRYCVSYATVAATSATSGSRIGPIIGFSSPTFRETLYNKAYQQISGGNNYGSAEIDITSYAAFTSRDPQWGQHYIMGPDGQLDFNRPAIVVGTSRIQGRVSVEGLAKIRRVIAVSMDTIDGAHQVVGQTYTNGDGEYVIDMVGFLDPVYLIVPDDHGQEFQASHAYLAGERVYPSAPKFTGLVYECTSPGTSGAEPAAWPDHVGDVVVTGTAAFTAREFFQPAVRGPIKPTIIAP